MSESLNRSFIGQLTLSLEEEVAAPSGRGVLVTGASGLLGRAVLAEFQKGGWRAVGTAYSRARGSLLRCDLLDEEAVRSLLNQHKHKMWLRNKLATKDTL
ncbi:unnamed protein product [Boreogadus saida]